MQKLVAQTGSLSVVTSPPGATVLVDGESVGTSPIHELRLDLGRHLLAIEKPGFETIKEHLTVAPGDSGPRAYDLAAVPVAPASRQPAGAVVAGAPARGSVDPSCASSSVASPRLLDALATLRSEELERQKRQRVLGYGLSAGGAALGVLAGALFVYNQGQHRAWRSEQRELDGIWQSTTGDDGPTARQDQNDALGASIQAVDKWTVGTAVAGGLLLTSGVILVVDSLRGGATSHSAAAPSPGALRFSF